MPGGVCRGRVGGAEAAFGGGGGAGGGGGGGGGGAGPVQPEQGGARDRRHLHHADLSAGRRAGQPFGDPAEELRVTGGEHPAAQHHGNRRPAEAEPPDHRARHRDDLVGQPADQVAGDLIPLGGRGRQRRGPALQVVFGDLAQVDGHRDVADLGQAEMAGHHVAQGGL